MCVVSDNTIGIEAATYVKRTFELYLSLGVILFCLELVEAAEGAMAQKEELVDIQSSALRVSEMEILSSIVHHNYYYNLFSTFPRKLKKKPHVPLLV